jgi:hypothetical protein
MGCVSCDVQTEFLNAIISFTPVQTLGSWVGIPLKVWMSAFILFVFCVGSWLTPVQAVLSTVYKIKKLKRNGVSRMPYALEESNRN